MHVIEKREAVAAESFADFGQEFRHYWSKLPDGTVFLGLLAAWCLLFQFFGWTSAIAGRTDSLFGWMWEKWTDPANDSSHGKLIPLVVLAFALGLHVVGFVVQQPRLSMVAFFSGSWILVGLVWGRKTLKVSFFP